LGHTSSFNPRGRTIGEGEDTSPVRVRIVTPSKRLNPRLRRDFDCGLPLAFALLTPAKRLNIQLSKIDTASRLPLGAQLLKARWLLVLPFRFNTSRIASG